MVLLNLRVPNNSGVGYLNNCIELRHLCLGVSTVFFSFV